MENSENELSRETLHKLIKQGGQALSEYLNALSRAADVKDVLDATSKKYWPQILSAIEDKEKRALVVSELDEDQWQYLAPKIGFREVATLIEDMESDDATDFIAGLPQDMQVLVLKRLPQHLRRELLTLLKYPEDSAGGIMQIELAQVDLNQDVGSAIECVKRLVEDDVEILSVWVVNDEDQLIGSVPLVDLLLNKSITPIKNIVERDVVSVKPTVDQEEVAQIFKKYDLITLPVVDDENHLIGRIVIDDIMDVVAEEADEDTLHMSGTSPEELVHQNNVLSSVRLRSPWLAVALGCSLISASMMKMFEVTLQSAIMTLYFIPVVTAMGGNVGTQSAAVLIRGFATNKIKLSEIPGFLFKEIRVGIVLGLLYGVLSGLAASLMFSNYNWYLGIVVFISMTLGLSAAATMGIVAPSVLKKLDFDPAISAGPFVTTFNDITGIIIYMATANLFLQYLE